MATRTLAHGGEGARGAAGAGATPAGSGFAVELDGGDGLLRVTRNGAPLTTLSVCEAEELIARLQGALRAV